MPSRSLAGTPRATAPRRHLHVVQHDGVGGHDRAGAHHDAVEHDRADADEAVVLDRAALEVDEVADDAVRSPTTVWWSSVVWTTQPSWIEVRAPMVMLPLSPRSTADGQTDDSGPITTEPITTASGWTNAVGSISGTWSPSAYTAMAADRSQAAAGPSVVRGWVVGAGTQPLRWIAMSRRIEVELTSARPDGTWTWRAAGAREPKGVVEGALVPSGAKVGDVLRVDADFDLDGITILAVLPPKAARKEPERLEIVGSGSNFEPVTSTLVAKRDRPPRDRRDRSDRPRRDGDGAGARGRGDRPDRDRPPRDRRDGATTTTTGDRPPRERREPREPRPRQERPGSAAGPDAAGAPEAQAAEAGPRPPQAAAREPARGAAPDRRAGAAGRRARRARRASRSRTSG